MGAVDFSIDPRLVEHLRRALPLSVFVETGTFEGEGVARMRPLFDEIHSVELSDEYYDRSQRRFEADSAVHLYHGDSAHVLGELQPTLRDRSVLYWLDAHWCVADGTAGAHSKCPLLEEVRAIGLLNPSSVIAIDDARLFLATPPAPHESISWPSFQRVLDALMELGSEHSLMVVNDMILVFPSAAREAVSEYARSYGVDWLAERTRLRALEEDHEKLSDALDDRLKAIETLTEESEERRLVIERLAADLEEALATSAEALDERLRAIEALTRTAEERRLVIERLAAELDGARDAIDAFSSQPLIAKAPTPQLAAHLSELEQALAQTVARGRPMTESEAAKLVDDARVRLELVEKELRRTYRPSPQRRIGRRVKAKLRGWFGPRIGLLVHYAPKPLCVPAGYLDAQPPTPAPVISVVTPSYQQARFLERTLCSVLGQGYPALEYFVQDGGSTDESVAVLQRYDEVLSGWASERDNGQADAINRAFARTSGEIMGWLNSDDLLLPGALAYVARYFVEHPDVDVVYGNRLMIDDNDGQIGAWILPRHDDHALSLADYVPQETLFWRRRIWEAAGGRVDNGFKYAMDWDLLLRFRQARATIVHLPRFLGAFRIHDEQKTTTAELIGLEEMSRLRERVHGRVVPVDEVLRRLRLYFAKHRVIHGWQRVLDRLPLDRAAVVTEPPGPSYVAPARRASEERSAAAAPSP